MFKDAITTILFPENVAPGSDAHVFRELLVTVWNRILLRLQDRKITEKEAEEIGFMLRRVWETGKMFREKNKQYTLSQWIKKLEDLAEEVGVSILP